MNANRNAPNNPAHLQGRRRWFHRVTLAVAIGAASVVAGLAPTSAPPAGAAIAVPTPHLVADIAPASGGEQGSSDATSFAALGSEVIFRARDDLHGVELWRYNPTSGTTTLLDKVPGFGDFNPRFLVSLGSLVVFSAETSANGTEPWVTDGTVAGTQMLADLVPGAAGSFPRDFASAGPTGYFDRNNTLWATKGVPGDPTMIFDGHTNVLGTRGNQLFFEGRTDATGFEPWVTDGTVAGTCRLATSAPDRLTRARKTSLSSTGKFTS